MNKGDTQTFRRFKSAAMNQNKLVSPSTQIIKSVFFVLAVLRLSPRRVDRDLI